MGKTPKRSAKSAVIGERTLYTNETPNAYVVVSLDCGPKALGQWTTEAEATTAYNGCAHAMMSAQRQTDLTQGAAGGQTTIWTMHK
ncbi:MAG: hypothetical protein NVSMB19_26410 [Vulcanimicrobiaceae bacterium]